MPVDDDPEFPPYENGDIDDGQYGDQYAGNIDGTEGYELDEELDSFHQKAATAISHDIDTETVHSFSL